MQTTPTSPYPFLAATCLLCLSAALAACHRAVPEASPPSPPPQCADAPTFAAYLDACGEGLMVEILRELVAFPTIAAEEPPASAGPFTAMAHWLDKYARAHGMRFERYGQNDAWEVVLGEGPRLVSFVTHADVVPAPRRFPNETWRTPPFTLTDEAGRLYGRGAEDDKGAIAAVLTLLTYLQGHGQPLAGSIALVMGTAEEHDWEGMRRYAAQAEATQFVVSLDARFPVVVGESGFVAWHLGFGLVPTVATDTQLSIASAQAGEFLTQVPPEAHMVVTRPEGLTRAAFQGSVQAAVDAARAAFPPHFGFEVVYSEPEARVAVQGMSVHSSNADEGHNPLWPLAHIAAALDSTATPAAEALRLVHEVFSNDHHGAQLGLAYTHPAMAPLLVAATVLRADASGATLDVNMRRPAGKDSAAFSDELTGALRALQATFPTLTEREPPYVGEPVLVPSDTPLVQVLLEAYAEEMGDRPAPITIRGSTYARLFPGAVSFGPSFPGAPYTGHAPNEFIDRHALVQFARILGHATTRLLATGTPAEPRP